MTELELRAKHIENWLDRTIKAQLFLRCCESLNNEIEVIVPTSDELHIYKGLELIAFYLGKTITYDPNWNNERGEMSLMYKDWKIFQLWDRRQ